MKKILLISSTHDNHVNKSHRGTAYTLEQTAEAFSEQGHQVTLLLLRKNNSKKFNYINFSGTTPLNLNLKKPYFSEFPFNTDFAITKMLQYAWEHKNNYDYIINFGHEYIAFCMIELFKQQKAKFFCIPNLCLTDSILDEKIKEISLKYPKNVLFISNTQKKLFLGNDYKKCTSSFFYHNINPIISFKEKQNKPIKTALFAGWFIKQKGFHQALEVCKKADIKLLAAGEIIDKEYFTHLKTIYNFDFLGTLSKEKLYQVMRENIIFLQLQETSWQEAFGLTTIEALAHGMHVIYTNSGANIELISQIGNGTLVHNIDEAVYTIKKFTFDAEKTKKAQINVLEKFSRKKIFSALIEHLNNA